MAHRSAARRRLLRIHGEDKRYLELRRQVTIDGVTHGTQWRHVWGAMTECGISVLWLEGEIRLGQRTFVAAKPTNDPVSCMACIAQEARRRSERW